MAPGPKRKGKKDVSNQRGNLRQGNANTPNLLNEGLGEVKQENEVNFHSDKLSEAERKDDGYTKGNYKKYSRRQVQSNWDRYEERTPGLLDDTRRGESFEVLACYQGGSDSYLKLKEEKEWCNTKDLQDDLILDCDELAQSLKCVPLHKRLHISEDCFTPEMIQKFKEVAERSYSQKLNTPLSLLCLKEDLPALATFSNIKDVSTEINYKPKVISEKTESIILSLTSCTAQKGETSSMLPKVEEKPTNDTQDNTRSKPETPHDDYAFLLSLSGTDKNSLDVVEEKSSTASIEDWLNELLEK